MLHSCAFLFSCRPSWSCNGCSTWSRCVHFEHGSVIYTICSLYLSTVAEWQHISLTLIQQLTNKAWSLLAMGSQTHSVHSLTFASAFHFDWFLSWFVIFNVLESMLALILAWWNESNLQTLICSHYFLIVNHLHWIEASFLIVIYILDL